MNTPGNTTARVLTAEGRGAVAVILVRGPSALAVVDQVFQPSIARSLRETGKDRPRVGRIGGNLGDEVVVIPLGTSPPSVEIHCHGGIAAVAAVLDVLRSRGVETIGDDAPESIGDTRWATRAMQILPFSPTLRVAEILLDQAAGCLDRAMSQIEEIARVDSLAAIARIESLLASAPLGLRLISGWTIALAGRPNVGKSRLLNRLAGFDRAIVAEVPGTTRDVLNVTIAMEGWPIDLLDLAGLRSTQDDLESQGIDRAIARLERADLVIGVLDGSQVLTTEDQRMLRDYPEALRVANKSDRPAAWNPDDHHAIAISAETGTGIQTLSCAIVDRLVSRPPEPGAAVAFVPEVVDKLHRWRLLLASGESTTG